MFSIPERFAKEIYFRNIGIVIVALIVPNVAPDLGGDLPWPIIYMKSYLYTFCFWQGDVLILRYFRKKFPAISDTIKRIAMTIMVALLYTLVVEISVGFLLSLIGIDKVVELEKIFDHSSIDLIATLIVGALYESNYFFSNWRQSLIETERLKTQNLKSQLDVLKNQISPHFLFNSLNTLTALIPEDPKLATEFTERLSKVYRYILLHKEKELVPLRTELDFTKSYTFLLKLRFNRGVEFKYNIDDTLLDNSIAPLTLQMLIENALKHNVTSNAHPLVVDIYVENGESIIVKNNLQLKHSVNDSTHTGLENIKKRYSYLSNREVDVIVTANHFMVSLPLLKVERSHTELILES